MKQEQQMAECFNIEELEERLEFADWEASASGTLNESGDYSLSGAVKGSW